MPTADDSSRTTSPLVPSKKRFPGVSKTKAAVANRHLLHAAFEGNGTPGVARVERGERSAIVGHRDRAPRIGKSVRANGGAAWQRLYRSWHAR